MQSLEQWRFATQSSIRLSGVECQPFDRAGTIHQFHLWATEMGLTLYLSNPGYAAVQQVSAIKPNCYATKDTELEGKNLLHRLVAQPQPGIFLVEGVDLEQQTYTVQNLFEALRGTEVACYVVLLAEQIIEPLSLAGMLAIFKVRRPDRQQIRSAIDRFCQSRGWEDISGSLGRAVQGLSLGEIDWILARESANSDSVESLAQRLVDYKINKLRRRGLEFISEPDVPKAVGTDLLSARLDRISALLDPAARQHNLEFPKGLLLWGMPGTGKSLSAKLAAKKMSVPLLSADWNGLRGATPTESLQNLRFLLDTAEAIAPCILYFDDFDKGFAGWDTDITSKQSAQRLLTWMQEHTAPVLVLATINRLGMLPVELQRRLPEIFFFDLPHDGARYEIFKLHLAKYFPAFREMDESPFTDEQWRALLTEYRLCIPDEIGNAVRRVAEECFYQQQQEGKADRPLEVSFEQLLAQRQAFAPALIRSEGPMLEIRNNATYAKPVSSPDTSRFARPKMELFGADY
ncbi:AAA family ATPase [Desertifilum sp. FACHB-1129]|uniref:ATP-binding protein n=1 Tax=unclassified Desertifilum TaxID=2621682 RepID=UPI0016869873|nr:MULTISPECIES: AAA family ATPase [unclassified Desertifilum]MBD2311234.1 AAA family ATPase [Desertifilum sp. FACHB-1129]MBD2324321.1 AAA family ATPase [Desertifilum sp. FACHB-866]MBD2334335.1 AAA family ATPase [Desertifilum sp. FACHB-868]MDA0213181.1 AAA family ATPase [Cyanobacteria bacterium FC1]